MVDTNQYFNHAIKIVLEAGEVSLFWFLNLIQTADYIIRYIGIGIK